jgi:hypothetical protein
MSRLASNENPGAGTPGLLSQTKNMPEENSNSWPDEQTILRDGGWEFASIFVACGVSAMAAFCGGSLPEIEASLLSARLALIEAISAFRELQKIEGAR